jgi:hypothetical protein
MGRECNIHGSEYKYLAIFHLINLKEMVHLGELFEGMRIILNRCRRNQM